MCIDSLGGTYCEKKSVSNLFMMRREMFLIQKSCNKERNQNNNKTYTCQCKCIEYMIASMAKLAIDIPESNYMYEYFYNRSYPENSSMYTIQYYQKYKIQKRKECHKNENKY